VQGEILSDRVKCPDWRVMKAKRLGRLPDEMLDETVGKILTPIDPEDTAHG
jgi:mRNA-degrading endonuclease toxin of MazEF toxin-antitoxin module